MSSEALQAYSNYSPCFAGVAISQVYNTLTPAEQAALNANIFDNVTAPPPPPIDSSSVASPPPPLPSPPTSTSANLGVILQRLATSVSNGQFAGAAGVPLVGLNVQVQMNSDLANSETISPPFYVLFLLIG